MADESGYQRQVATRAAPGGPLARPEDFGAGLAAQIGQAAEQQNRQDLRAYQIERQATANREWTEFQRRLVTAEENQSGITREARANWQPGHAQRMGETWEAHRDAILSDITDDEVRQRALAQFEQAGSRLRMREADFEDVAGIQRTLTDYGAAEDARANVIRRLEDPQDYTAMLVEGHQAIDGLNIPDDRKAQASREWDQKAAIAFLRGRIDADPAMAKALLSEGVFDDALTPDQVNALMNNAEVGIRSIEVEARRKKSEAEAATREQIATLEEADRQGIVLPEEQYAAATAAAAAMGDQSLALKIDGLAANRSLAKIYEQAPPVLMQQRMAELAGMGKRSADQDRELKYLQDHIGARSAAFDRDPAGEAAKFGSLPAIDLATGEGVQERSAWARTASRAYGRPVPPLTAAEASQLKGLWASEKQGAQRQVMEQLARFPADQAAAAARLVDPTDPQLAVMASLPPGPYRALALRGRDALKANKALLKTDDPALESALADFDTRFTQALRAVPPAERDAILKTARQIAAGSIDQSGGELTADTYWKSLNMALGAYGTGADRKGGLGRWGDRWFLLPDGVSGTAFGAAAKRAAEGGQVKPVNPDGSPATLSRAFPVMIAPGAYEFHTAAGEVVMGSNKRPWVLRVRPQ